MVKIKYYDVAPVESIAGMISAAGEECPEKIAYRYKQNGEIKEITYSDFISRVYSLGAYLNSKGCDEGNIACIGANSFNYINAYFSALRGKGAFVPIDKELPEKDILHLLKECECTALFLDKKYIPLVEENREELKSIRLLICLDGETENIISVDNAVLSGEKLDKSDYLKTDENKEKMKLLVFTSGTTGMAKGVMLSEKNLITGVYNGLRVSTVYTTGLSVLPYNHTYESVSDILVSFHHHSTLCINESLTSLLKNLKIYKPDYIYVVPAIAEMFYSRLMREISSKGMTEQFEKAVARCNAKRKIGIDKRRETFSFIHEVFGGNLIKMVCGGAPIRPEVGEFFDNIGIALINGYGITECSPLVCANPDKANDYHTAGVRLPCVQWKIDEPNAEGIGEILVKGDIVMLGYYKNPELTKEVFKDGWFCTGDYGKITEDDRLIISGRKKNIIVLNNGKNIYPEEIEGYIQGIDYVNEVIVSGEKDNNGNENSLMAEVFLNERKSPSQVLRSIKDACKDLPAYKQISKVLIRDKEFEKTTTNKIKRK